MIKSMLVAAALCGVASPVAQARLADRPAAAAAPKAVGAAPAVSAAASAQPVTAVVAKPPIRKLNGHLVDMKGRGIYVWDGDRAAGRSTCNSQCRLLWPPIVAEPGAKPVGGFTIVGRDDGTRQWALGDRPLYRWVSDVHYGDAGGDGIGDKWHLVKVKASASASQTPP